MFRSRSARLASRVGCLVIVGALAAATTHATAVPDSADPAAGIEFFEKRIRPVLVEHCYDCHSERGEKPKGGLVVDSREGLLHGGDLGPALVPGDPEKSLLVRAVRYSDPDLQMPPKKGKLGDRQIADLARWVRMGAPWPADARDGGKRVSKPAAQITDTDRNWWAFRPIVFPAVPAVPGLPPGTHPVDAFVASALAAKGLAPNPPATPRERVRRLYFDLIGLPPEPEAVAAFEADPSPDAWRRLVDRLLAMPQYGERWARHWLDVVRFAQSNGYERDGEKPLAWRYRDYVVDAFNSDKPYDLFVREQIAGDLLEPYRADAIVATGFQRLGVWDDEPDDKRMAEFDELDDILSTTGSAFLGLTLGCARCHEHKFDPFPQADYYRLLAFFRNIRPHEGAKYALDSSSYLPLADPEAVREWRDVREIRLRRLQEDLAATTGEAERKEITEAIAATKAETPPWPWALGVAERGATPPPTHVLIRGNAGTPGPEVEPGFPPVLNSSRRTPPPGQPRRLALADWIASPDNPLTARVFVNRVWQHLFGRGLAKTPSDFGKAGLPPTHPELLQWLAADFLANGWSVKALQRRIVLSETYQRSSRAEGPAAAADPGNDLFWRQNLRRLDAEALRDTYLAVGGRLDLRPGGRGFFPRLGGEVLAGQSRPGLDWEVSGPSESARRSLYVYVRRTMMVPFFEAFDYSNTTSPLPDRPVTTVAPQALLLLNDEFLREQAAALGDRLTLEVGPDPRAVIRRGFERVLGRPPTDFESRRALDFMKSREADFEHLRSRLTFRPEVPPALSVDYMAKLSPEHFLSGPATGWTYHRGRWSGAYEGIRSLHRDQGPFALWQGGTLSNGVVEVLLVPHVALESAGLLFRASAKDDVARGYELELEARERRLRLRRHGTNTVDLASAPVGSLPADGLRIRVRLRDDRIEVRCGDDTTPSIDVRDPEPILGAGRFGVRAWGAAASLRDLVVRPDGGPAAIVYDGGLEPPSVRAVHAFCLLLLNLNETVYID
ncbi:MAG: PSD1 domain-containing protein [Verrucomicrobiales bacterium]|nr:PSD1 domain-containing protein [Verrucomicrobiales bacterium]